MRPLETVAVARAPDGCELVLARRGEEWLVRVDGKILMSSRLHGSEQALARESLARLPAPADVLVGGLGLGYTLRALLDRVSERCQVTVAELVPELVDWNREQLASLHAHALDDPRCRVVVGDVRELLRRSRAAFDLILLDVDNGPVAVAHSGNQELYSPSGLAHCRTALRPGGMLAIWSAGPSPSFEQRLEAAGFEHERLEVPARDAGRARHVLFFAKRR